MVSSLLISFLLSTLLAWTYQRTFQGLSYSRSFVQALVLSSIVTNMAMLAIGDSLTRGLGMMGALAMIRFRTNLRDHRDMIFIFCALAIGISSGVYRWEVAFLGTTFFCLFAYALFLSPFSATTRFDGLLRFQMTQEKGAQSSLEEILAKHCRVFALITLREQARGLEMDYAYQVKLKGEVRQSQLLAALKEIPSVRGASLLLQEATVEI